jgi:hypothetical protein
MWLRWDTANVSAIVAEEQHGRRPLGTAGRCDANIQMDFRKMCYEDRRWIDISGVNTFDCTTRQLLSSRVWGSELGSSGSGFSPVAVSYQRATEFFGSTEDEVLSYKLEGRGFESRWGRFFHPSSRTVALGSTQPLTEMSTRNLSGG